MEIVVAFATVFPRGTGMCVSLLTRYPRLSPCRRSTVRSRATPCGAEKWLSCSSQSCENVDCKRLNCFGRLAIYAARCRLGSRVERRVVVRVGGIKSSPRATAARRPAGKHRCERARVAPSRCFQTSTAPQHRLGVDLPLSACVAWPARTRPRPLAPTACGCVWVMTSFTAFSCGLPRRPHAEWPLVRSKRLALKYSDPFFFKATL